ncbi:MAG: YlzJ-like family protein [Tuberibacillus sp.]
MLLYTLIPMEQIFGEDEEEGKKRRKRKTMDIGGVTLEVEQSSDSEYEIVKLISSNPADFLDSRYQPGSKITMKPQWG